MRKPKLTLLDWINLILILLGFILLAKRVLFPQAIFLVEYASVLEEPFTLLLAIGSLGEILSLIMRSRTARIFTLFLLIFTVAPVLVSAATAPKVAMHVVAHSQGEEYRVSGELDLPSLDSLEVIYEAREGVLYKYAFATSGNPISCPEITGIAAREDTSHEVTIGEVKPPKSGIIYFAACVLELDESWKHEVVGSIEKAPEGYIIRTSGRTEKVFDVIAFLEHNILVPILVSVLSTLVTVYIAHKKGWKV